MIENFFTKKVCCFEKLVKDSGVHFFVSPKRAEKPKNNPTGQHGITPFKKNLTKKPILKNKNQGLH